MEEERDNKKIIWVVDNINGMKKNILQQKPHFYQRFARGIHRQERKSVTSQTGQQVRIRKKE